MLTGDLVRARVSKSTLIPTFINVERDDLVGAAGDLTNTFAMAAQERWRRRELEEAITACIGDSRSHKIIRGLAKLLLDKCEFEVVSPLPPPELRMTVFARARQMGPLALDNDKLDRITADHVLAHVARDLGADVDVIADALYADLKSEQRITKGPTQEPQELLHRYNVALVQALLLKSHGMSVTLHGATVSRARQLLRYAKFHQLMIAAESHGEVLKLVFDGPTSMFKQSTRYGLALATFFPAVLLQDCPWTLEATVLWTKRRLEKTLVLEHTQGLVSHYRDTGGYETKQQAWFKERFSDTDTDWTLRAATKPIPLGERAVALPDFTLRKGKKRAHLEIIGFWQKEWLERRLRLIAKYGPGNLIVAVSNKLAGSKDLADLPIEVVRFANIVPVRDVLDAADRVTR